MCVIRTDRNVFAIRLLSRTFPSVLLGTSFCIAKTFRSVRMTPMMTYAKTKHSEHPELFLKFSRDVLTSSILFCMMT